MMDLLLVEENARACKYCKMIKFEAEINQDIVFIDKSHFTYSKVKNYIILI